MSFACELGGVRPPAAAALAALALVLAHAGCKCDATARVGRAVSSSAEQPETRQRADHLPPLRATRASQNLALRGFRVARAIIPLGATDARPVLIVLHGAGADPNATCAAWRRVTDYGFVLCPRGILDAKSPPGTLHYTFGSPRETVLELRAALGALRQHFGNYVAPGPVVLAGVALGALRAVWILREEPGYFARVVLVQTGHDPWSSGLAAIFAKRGGKRILFVCANASCRRRVRDDVVVTRHAGSRARSTLLGGEGAPIDLHRLSALAPDFRWLVAGDPDWHPPVARR